MAKSWGGYGPGSGGYGPAWVPGLDQRGDYGRVAREWPGMGYVWPKFGADMANGGAVMAHGGVPGLVQRGDFGRVARNGPGGAGMARCGVCMA